MLKRLVTWEWMKLLFSLKIDRGLWKISEHIWAYINRLLTLLCWSLFVVIPSISRNMTMILVLSNPQSYRLECDVEMLSSGLTYVVSRRRILAYDGFLLQYFLWTVLHTHVRQGFRVTGYQDSFIFINKKVRHTPFPPSFYILWWIILFWSISFHCAM